MEAETLTDWETIVSQKVRELRSKSDLRGGKWKGAWENPQSSLDTSVLGLQLGCGPKPPQMPIPFDIQLLFLKGSGGKESGVRPVVSSDGLDTRVVWSYREQTPCLPWGPSTHCQGGREMRSCLTLQWGKTELLSGGGSVTVTVLNTGDWAFNVVSFRDMHWQENGLSVILNGWRSFPIHRHSWGAILETRLCHYCVKGTLSSKCVWQTGWSTPKLTNTDLHPNGATLSFPIVFKFALNIYYIQKKQENEPLPGTINLLVSGFRRTFRLTFVSASTDFPLPKRFPSTLTVSSSFSTSSCTRSIPILFSRWKRHSRAT